MKSYRVIFFFFFSFFYFIREIFRIKYFILFSYEMLKSYFLNAIRFLLFRFINTEFFFFKVGGFSKGFFSLRKVLQIHFHRRCVLLKIHTGHENFIVNSYSIVLYY